MLLMVMNLKKKINNKVAIVTGAGSGTGKALEGGHYLPEEKPYQVANQILNFLE